jgi:hypothetical protein
MVLELHGIVPDRAVHNTGNVQADNGSSRHSDKSQGDDYKMSPLIQAMGAVIESAWKMITTVKYPGSEIPIGVILVGAFVVGFGIRILAYTLRMTVNVGSSLDKIPREKRVKKP